MRIRVLAAFSALCAVFSMAGAHADVKLPVPVNRSTEPVVLTGAQFPSWSAGPEFVAHEPQIPVNYDTADIQPYLGPLASDCYRPADHPNPYDYSDNGDHNCYHQSRVPNNPNVGADVTKIIGYKWNPHPHHGEGKFVQIPLQVDEVFTRYISNNVSGFAFYSGVDKETTYAWDTERFRFTWDDFLYHGGNPCIPAAAPGPDGQPQVTTPDPVKGLDDNDEIAFMYSDAGDAAPAGAPRPEGLKGMFDVALVDPSNPANVKHAYIGLSAGGAHTPSPDFDASNGYVKYERDPGVRDPNDLSKWLTPPADMFVYSQSSYGDYGAAPHGAYCNRDGSIATTSDPNYTPPAGVAHPSNWLIRQRRPLDTAWVRTDKYAFRYDGRWLMTELHVSPTGHGLTNNDYGVDIIDQWKARAFQQRPGDPNDPAAGTTPCCGYEEEVNNWGGSSILFGERVGPVRAIRAAWGADSSTNNIKTETFYKDEIRFDDNLRVHVIPPADGIYVQWDYNAGAVERYYNPNIPAGVPADGQNDESFGNTKIHVAGDRLEFTDDDPIPAVGPQHVSVPLDPSGDPNRCEFQGDDSATVCNDIDLADPTFSGAAGNLNWEEVAGPNGSVVTRWAVRRHSGGDANSVIAQPYYRDDSCFDDGTGTNPGPHLKSRDPDSGAYSYWTNPLTGETVPRVCWHPGDPITGDPAWDARYWQGDIATHGLHIQLIADSDNADQTEPLDEIDSEQRMVVLSGNPGNVGDAYGRHVEFPMQAVVTPYPF